LIPAVRQAANSSSAPGIGEISAGHRARVVLLERGVGGPRRVFVAEDVPEDLDLRLAHRRPGVLHRVVELGDREVATADRGGERLHDGVVVADGRAGHVEADDRETAHRKVSSAIAGEQVMPRPPGPVTRTTPGVTALRW